MKNVLFMNQIVTINKRNIEMLSKNFNKSKLNISRINLQKNSSQNKSVAEI